jgi:hypothetical protein
MWDGRRIKGPGPPKFASNKRWRDDNVGGSIEPTMIAALLTSLLAVGASAVPRSYPGKCPPFHRGSFNINQYQLYPENADWDANRCLVLFG